MRHPRAVWLAMAVLQAVTGAAAREPEVTLPVRVAVADFIVTGLDQPRYWLGYVYADVLSHRLQRCDQLLVTPPLTVRQQPATVGPQNLDALAQHAFLVGRKLGVAYVLTGQLHDQGGTLNVTCLVVLCEGDQPRTQALEQEVRLQDMFVPQTELVVRRILPNMNVRLAPAQIDLLAAYDPDLGLATLEQLGQGWRAYAPEEPEAAFRIWRQALADAPDASLVAEALASASNVYRKRLLAQALSFYEGLVTKEPDNAVARFNLAEIYSDMNRWAEAETQYLAATDLRNTYIEAYLGLGIARLQQGQFQPAVMAFDSALHLDPNNVKVMHNKAVAFFRRGLTQQAIDVWRRILELDPEDAVARERLTRYGTGRTEEAGGM